MLSYRGTIFLFTADGTYESCKNVSDNSSVELASITAQVSSELVWSLIDTGNLQAEPEERVYEGKVFAVQTASPDEKRYKNFAKVRTCWSLGIHTLES